MRHSFRQRRKIRKRHKSYRNPGVGISKFHASLAIPILKLSGLILGIAALVLIVIFVVVPLLTGSGEPQEPAVTPNAFLDPAEGGTQNIEEDLSSLQKEAVMRYNSVNDAYLSGKDIVFSSTTVKGGVTVYDKLVVYDTQAMESEEVSGIALKYENIVETKICPGYIVFVDSNPDGGGRILAYDREKQEQFLIKEYAYSLPQLSLYGNTLAFVQQAGETTDKLYLFDLETRESVCYKMWEELPAAPANAWLGEAGLVYAVPYTQSGAIQSTIYVKPLDGGGEKSLDVNKYVSSPSAWGSYIAFTSHSTGPLLDLYVSEDGALPELVADQVVNYAMGQGFLAYTKEDAVYIYSLENKSHIRLNTDISRGIVSSVNGTQVLWYDVTGGYNEIDVVKYADLAERRE